MSTPDQAEAREVTLSDVIRDCGGYAEVARALGLGRAAVYAWGRRGRMPWSELDGRTDYSRVLASMQRCGRKSADEIRRIGLTL